MNRKESIYFVIGIALTAVLFTFLLNGTSPWVSMAQISVFPTPTKTSTPPLPPTPIPPTFTPTPIPPTFTPTPIPPTSTPTPIPPTSTPTPVPPPSTPTPIPPTPTPVPPTPTPSNVLPIVNVDHPVITADEGSLAQNSGSAVDPDGSVVAVLASVGSLSFDGTAWTWEDPALDGPDGRLVIIAAVDNSGAIGQTTFFVQVNNVAPVVGALLVPPDPIAVDEPFIYTILFTEPFGLDSHIAEFSWDDGTRCVTGRDAECSLDEGTGGVGSVTASHIYTEAGLYTLSLSVIDDDGGVGTATAGPVVVYDPSAGFATGGGWIDSPPGAFAADAWLAGRARFSFVSRYQKGARAPDGSALFQFKAARLKFASSSYDWLVVTGGNYARFKGSGTIQGDPGAFEFMLWAGDGTSRGGEDTFRIKIWREDTGVVVYDNGMNQAIGAGNIKVHSGR